MNEARQVGDIARFKFESSGSDDDSDYESIKLQDAGDIAVLICGQSLDSIHQSQSSWSDYNNLSDKILLGTDYRISQLLKACSYDDLTRGKSAACSAARLEAERILCLMYYENNLVQDRISYNELNLNVGTITIKNVKLKLGKRNRGHKQHYFFCLLRHCDVFYATTVAKTDSSGIVDFRVNFELKKVSSDFKLTVFKCSQKKKKWLKINCCATPDNLDYDCPSKFCDWGHASIQSLDLLEPENINRPSIEINVEGCEMTAEIVAGTSLDLNLAGVLDFCEENGECLFWQKTYVILKGTYLILFKYPQGMRPLKVLDLERCLSIKVADELLERRTLYLEFEQEGGGVFWCFLAAENKGDFDCWRRYLELVVVTAQKLKQI